MALSPQLLGGTESIPWASARPEISSDYDLAASDNW
jgi:hypothetical protein